MTGENFEEFEESKFHYQSFLSQYLAIEKEFKCPYL